MTARRRVRLWEISLKHAQQNRVVQKNWPKPPDSNFERMSTELQATVNTAVISVTDDAHIVDWMWNPYERRFDFVLLAQTTFDGMPVGLKTCFFFDPRKAWRDEVERLMGDAEQHVRLLRETLERKNKT